MGFFDAFESDQERCERHERSYGEGVEEARSQSVVDAVVDGIGDFFDGIVPSTTEDDSYERGYHDWRSGR